MKKVLIVGASSGMGRALALEYARRGCRVGLTGRREGLLQEIQRQYPEQVLYSAFDVTEAGATGKLEQLVDRLGGLDLLIISAGRGSVNPELDPDTEDSINNLNVRAFCRTAVFGFRYFQQQGHGQLAAITSLAALRGNREAPAYGATKAYQTHYLEGLRQRARKLHLPVTVTDIRPGFVDNADTEGVRRFWSVPLEKAGRQLFRAIEKKRKIVYVSRRWTLVALLLKVMPRFIYDRL
ncbi:SDR family NAD(P)-dependent oxidoreductase [Compostibacter hankyongensis]|uniref:SDR family NAD(P)-dependent oxidoreductase n=1 Tax=Compostibacter hankyongensis TaxID=1007089 RepID=A0ABP8G738_9BACT